MEQTGSHRCDEPPGYSLVMKIQSFLSTRTVLGGVLVAFIMGWGLTACDAAATIPPPVAVTRVHPTAQAVTTTSMPTRLTIIENGDVYQPTAMAPTPTPKPTPALTTIRAIGISYEDVSTSRTELPTLHQQATIAGVNMVGLNAGRPDWAYFRWEGRAEYWSSAVRDTGIDFLAEDTVWFADGHVNAMVDIYAPNYIAAHPDAAAISYWGEPSPLLVSTAALTSGPFHDLVLEMIAALAANYAVDSISITELSYRLYGYGLDDLALYQAHTGREDWPRDRDGVILFEHPSIGEWRSAAVAGFLADAAAITQAHGKELFFDVAVSWGDLANEGREYGHDYAKILRVVDRIIVWAYTDLAGYPPDYAAEIADYLAEHYQPDQIILSIGLWGPNETVMKPASLALAVAAIQATNITHIWITPTSLMTSDHWASWPTFATPVYSGR